ncbi:hypothetical protein CDAR_42131 [Caerostris darwini]|uniref:Uncharacterized protein n=1 Tax=Caerostris darwini TaxID=1538125 RepID=A0AAV4RJX4_9ARAC|nr:hypothetical protein CDAR_42131 [Caerostris darwini]
MSNNINISDIVNASQPQPRSTLSSAHISITNLSVLSTLTVQLTRGLHENDICHEFFAHSERTRQPSPPRIPSLTGSTAYK